jgi:hypothetical protein
MEGDETFAEVWAIPSISAFLGTALRDPVLCCGSGVGNAQLSPKSTGPLTLIEGGRRVQAWQGDVAAAQTGSEE